VEYSVVAVEGDGLRSVEETGFEPLPVTASESRPVTADTEERGGSPPNPPEESLHLKKVDPAPQTEQIDVQGQENVIGEDAIVEGRVEEGEHLPRLQKLLEESEKEVEGDGGTSSVGEPSHGKGIESSESLHELTGKPRRASSSFQLMVRAQSVKELEKEILNGRQRRQQAAADTGTWPKWRCVLPKPSNYN